MKAMVSTPCAIGNGTPKKADDDRTRRGAFEIQGLTVESFRRLVVTQRYESTSLSRGGRTRHDPVFQSKPTAATPGTALQDPAE